MTIDLLGFYIFRYGQRSKLADSIFFIEDFLSLGEVATRLRGPREKKGKERKRKDNRAILECFVEYPGIWTYKIYTNPKKFLGRYVDRQTIQRCVRELSKEGLIDRDERERKQGKKLSIVGIYYLFLNIEEMRDRIFKAILNNYGENILFKLFLYPYLNKDSLFGIQDYSLLSRIYLHLNQCCIDVSNISYSENDAYIWRMVPAHEPEARRLLDFLQEKCGLSSLKDASLAISGDNNSLRIRRGANYASIKLDNDKKTATMEIKEMEIKEEEKQKEYSLCIKEPYPEFFRISKPLTSAKHYAAHDLMVKTQRYVPSLLFDLASKVDPGFSDFEILLRDEKFMQSLDKVKVKFDSRCKSLKDSRLK